MKWNENCLEHGRAAQYFERERQEYRQKIKAAQQSVQRIAFGAFTAGVLVGVVVSLTVYLVQIGVR
jgi:hypothetical protein